MTPRSILLPIAVFLGIVALLATGAWIYFHFFSTPPGPARVVTRSPVEPPPPLSPPPSPDVAPRELPPLARSDAFVREAVTALVSHPKAARWLAPQDLIRRFVAAVDNVAQGESPRSHLLSLAPEGTFTTRWEDGKLILDPAEYRRYDSLAAAFSALDTGQAVELYRQLRPLFDQAYRELGYPAGGFEEALLRAIDRLLAAPDISHEIELKRRVTTFQLADPTLEGLDAAQKHLLRAGPENTRKIQAKLRLLRRILSSSSEASP